MIFQSLSRKENKIKKLNLSQFSTDDLKSLRIQIKDELIKRGHFKPDSYKKSIMRRISFIHGLKPLNNIHENEQINNINLCNGNFLLSLPIIEGDPTQWEPYLSSLLNQNWKCLFPRETEEGDYYVYAHVDPRHNIFVTSECCGGNYGGRPFYIGKGTGNRAYDLKRNEGHGKTIKEILKDEYSPSHIVKILFSGLSEQKALEIESKLIYFFRTQYSKRRKGWLVNLSEPPIPEFKGIMQILPKDL